MGTPGMGTVPPVLDELDKYLACEPPPLNVNVLEWWKARELIWPALAKMVKQYFAAPATSAGVERVFSKAWNRLGPALSRYLVASTFCIFIDSR